MTKSSKHDFEERVTKRQREIFFKGILIEFHNVIDDSFFESFSIELKINARDFGIKLGWVVFM